MRVLPQIVIRKMDSDSVHAILGEVVIATFDLRDGRSFRRSVPHRVRQNEVVAVARRSGDFERQHVVTSAPSLRQNAQALARTSERRQRRVVRNAEIVAQRDRDYRFARNYCFNLNVLIVIVRRDVERDCSTSQSDSRDVRAS